ncbi:MAG TPA: AIPR family protein [Candidatus Binatia bacterium]|jgi:hypothetical protein|nr:AIPR family protein [Candidatus Udaeobacter sp.]
MSKIDLTYPKLLDLFPEHLDPNRSESGSFLIWYLENYLRLDSVDAVDAICDQSGDKGIDGVYINEDSGTVEVYQSKISQKAGRTIGDTLLKEFAGTLKQFESAGTLHNLVKSAGKADVARLIERLDLIGKVGDYAIKGVFISNADLDSNGEAYLGSHDGIRFVGKTELTKTFISASRDARITKPALFDVSGHETSKYVVDKDHEAIIAPVKATELIKLDGIANQALFAFNVRGPLGRTQVNKDIAVSVRDRSRHKMFPLFHNGITIIAKDVTNKKGTITINDYYVVNGCQSLSELHKNAMSVTDELRILVKIIKMDASSPLSEMVTTFSNNQNGVKPRDFKSNNPIQIRLQNEIATEFGNEFYYEIKRGESSSGKTVITNENAGLHLLAFDLKRPWATHRKYQVFEDDYAEIFGRPVVKASRLVLCQLLANEVDSAITRLKNSLFAKYALTRYLMLFIVRLVLEEDDLGKKIIASPHDFVFDKRNRAALIAAISRVLDDVIIDLNAEVAQLGEDFDYRGRLRDEAWVKSLAHKVVGDHRKLVARDRILPFSAEFGAALKKIKTVPKQSKTKKR